MNDKKIITHPSIIHSATIADICRPLENLYGIDYFCHVNVDNNGHFSALGKNPKFVEHYLKSKYYNCDIHLSKTETTVEYVLQDSVGHHGATNQLFQDCEDFGLHHIFTILQRNKSSVDAYHFATSIKNNKINEVYLRVLPLLQKFVSYFKENTAIDKNLSKAYDFKYTIDDDSASYESDMRYLHGQSSVKEFINSIDTKRHHVLDCDSGYLTKRELECILWLHHGKTADETAMILNISNRTVYEYIDNIKEKLQCHTMFQLGEKISQFNLIDIIKLYQDK